MERLQKVLAQAGIASRRAAEQIILAGRVRVDGHIVRELGTQVDPRKNRVDVDGVKIVAEKLVYIVLHKPRGVVCTLSDPEGRPTIRELIKDAGGRLVPVGRLDFHTSGALLCTNDGEFAQALAHPKREVPKVYVAKVKGTVDDDALERFGQRVVIDGRPTQPAQVKRLRYEGDKTWLEITLREGRNRQVRRLGEATGFPVMRLARISHAGITSEDVRPGQWRNLTVDELVDLKKDYGVPKKVRAPAFDPALAKKQKLLRERPWESKPVRTSTRGADKPARGGEKSTRGGHGADRPARGGRGAEKPTRAGYGAERPARGGYGAERPARGGYGAEKPTRGAERPTRGGYGAEKPTRGGYGAEKPTRGGYGAEKPTRGGYAAEKAPRFERAGERKPTRSAERGAPRAPERNAPRAAARNAKPDGRASGPRRGTSR